MEKTVYDYKKDLKQRNKRLWFCLSVILFLLSIFLIVISINADCNIIAYPSETSIKWDYSLCGNVINGSVDSYAIYQFVPQSGVFVLRDLQPNQTHTFMIYVQDTGYFSSESTTLEPKVIPPSGWDLIGEFFYEYLLVIVVLILLVIGIRIPFCGILAASFACIGLADTLIKGNFWLDWIFFITLLASIYVTGHGLRE
jgi:uncharacterized integral membrane protein